MSCSKQDYEALARVLYKCKPGALDDAGWDAWDKLIPITEFESYIMKYIKDNK